MMESWLWCRCEFAVMEIRETSEFGILWEDDPLCVWYVVTVLWLWDVAAQTDSGGTMQSQKWKYCIFHLVYGVAIYSDNDNTKRVRQVGIWNTHTHTQLQHYWKHPSQRQLWKCDCLLFVACPDGSVLRCHRSSLHGCAKCNGTLWRTHQTFSCVYQPVVALVDANGSKNTAHLKGGRSDVCRQMLCRHHATVLWYIYSEGASFFKVVQHCQNVASYFALSFSVDCWNRCRKKAWTKNEGLCWLNSGSVAVAIPL